jgi:hypothetical protein
VGSTDDHGRPLGWYKIGPGMATEDHPLRHRGDGSV